MNICNFKMKILLSFNEAYAPHGAAVITGLIRHSSQKLSIVVLYHELSEETIQKFTSFYSAQLETIEFIKVTVSPELEKRLKEIRSSFYLKGNIETWLRIFASSYIQDDYVVWLDCDIVVTGDICKILEEVDNQYFVSACKEYDPLYKMRDLDHTEEWASLDDWRNQMIYDAHYFRTYEYYDIPYHVPYFCAGIMYMNLKKWREEHLESQLLEKIYEYDYIFALDQDVLNSVIKGQFGVISPKWNTAINVRKCISNYPLDLLREAEEAPCIVHLGGGAKPWNENLGGPYRKMYWEYRLASPWPAKPHWKRRLKNKYRIVNSLAKSIGWLKSHLNPKKVQPIVSASFLDDKGTFLKQTLF